MAGTGPATGILSLVAQDRSLAIACDSPDSPASGEREGPWRIGDAPPDRRTHACAERGGRVRGSKRRILTDLLRRTAEPDSCGLEPGVRGLQALILPRGRLCRTLCEDGERRDFALTCATRSLQPGQHRRSLDPHPVELVRIDAEELEYCRGDLRCRDGCVDRLFGNIGMRND
jgi:hypothetical protein